VNRREVLGTLGVASARTLLWTFGCTRPRPVHEPVELRGGEVRTWLHEAVARLAGAGLAEPHALAVTARRTTAGRDVLGTSVQRARRDGVVLSVRDRDGAHREQVTADLSESGVAAAARALAGASAPGRLESGDPRVWSVAGEELGDAELLGHIDALAELDRALSSRIVYRGELLEIDDANVWSLASSHDLEQRLIRVRQSALRVGWNGTRPVVGEAVRAWLGPPNAETLTRDEIEAATRGTLAVTTPAAFEDGEHVVVLEPAIVARLVDAAAHALLTADAARRPDVAQRVTIGATLATPAVTVVDDPTAGGKYDAYGALRFDDTGTLAAPVTLIDHGRVAAWITARRRPGHLGALEAVASHLRMVPGTADQAALLADDGFVVEGPGAARVDAASGRVVFAIARARELRGGQPTGRTFADLEIAGDLARLLGSVAGISRQTQVLAVRDELAGRPRWRSLEMPWLRARALVRSRRSPV
jgi:predicted Zn-dependent protease